MKDFKTWKTYEERKNNTLKNVYGLITQNEEPPYNWVRGGRGYQHIHPVWDSSAAQLQ